MLPSLPRQPGKNQHDTTATLRSGKEVLSPAPPPLRTARAPFDASSSSIEQRPCEIRPSTAPPADDTPYGTRLTHWPWGQPVRYYGRASYRVACGGGSCTSKGHCDLADISASLPSPVFRTLVTHGYLLVAELMRHRATIRPSADVHDPIWSAGFSAPLR